MSEAQILAVLQKDGVQDIGLDDLVTLHGMLTAIKEGDTTPEQAFPGANIDKSTGEIKRPVLPACPQASLDTWLERIKTGKSNSEHASAMILSKYTLTDEQFAALNSAKPVDGGMTEEEKEEALALEQVEATRQREWKEE